MTPLKELLSQYDANILKTIANEHGIDPKNKPKSAVADLLASKLAERDEVERALTRVGPAEREILGLAQRAGGEVATSVLENAIKKSKQIAPPTKRNAWEFYKTVNGNPNYTGKPKLEDVAAHLALIGLAFAREPRESTKSTVNFELGRYLAIPSEILPLLPSFIEEKQSGVSEPSRIIPGSARNFQRDLSRYWSFVRREGKLDVTTQGWVYKKATAELGKALGWNDKSKLDEKNNSYFFFLRRMMSAVGLMNTEQISDWNTLLPTTFTASDEKNFWSLPPAERVKQSYEAYLDTRTWNELRVPAAVYGIDHRRPAPQELKAARHVIIEKIKKHGATASAWVDLSDLVQDLRLGHYNFLFPRSKKNTPYYGYPGNYSTPYYQSNNPYGVTYNNITDEASGWDLVEGAIITHIVTGPLHWLGLTDVGFDGDTPIAYRLTAMGAWLLGLGAEIQIAEQGGRVVVQPNFQIVAMEPIAEQVLMTLDEFTQFEGGDRALTYRLTRESVYRGQRNGWDAMRIVSYLEDATHTPLPQNVKRSLEEWQALHERITIRRGVSLLHAEDAATLDELFANAALTQKLGRRVGVDVALTQDSAPTVNSALRDAGWVAVFTRQGQTDAPASVAADEEGNVTLVHRTPSIYAYEGIEPFAERIDARHARITPASVDAARTLREKIDVPAMIARLRAVHRGEIPPRLIVRLKAWGKYFGDAKLGTLTLIEFRDEQARGELLNDPELKKHIERFDAGNRPLGLVRAESLERVKELLAERGVDIREWGEK